MLNNYVLKSSFSKLFVTSLIVGLGACSSKKANNEVTFDEAPAAEINIESSGAEQDNTNVSIGTHNTNSHEGRASGRAYSGSERAIVETTPFEKEGFLLNGVYFIRAGEESWAHLSQKLYGRPDRDQLLKQWNKGQSLKVGSAIYYNSPARPEDKTAMKPFAMDFGSSLEKHVVQRGESLSLIAQRLYGDPMSWKEISALNPEITNPDRIEIGQNIILQPQSVNTQAFLANLVNQTNQNQPQITENSSETEAQASLTPTETAANPPMEEEIAPPPSEPKPEIVTKRPEKRSENSFLSWFNFIKGDEESSNLFLVGIVLILGALVFLIINNRRKAARRHQEELANLTDFQQKTGTGHQE